VDFQGQGFSRSPAFDNDSIDARCHDIRSTGDDDVVGIYRDLVLCVGCQCQMELAEEMSQWTIGNLFRILTLNAHVHDKRRKKRGFRQPRGTLPRENAGRVSRF